VISGRLIGLGDEKENETGLKKVCGFPKKMGFEISVSVSKVSFLLGSELRVED
jgi:hypothetical protein